MGMAAAPLRVAHWDPLRRGHADYVDVRRVLTRLRAAVAYFSDSDDVEADAAPPHGRLLDTLPVKVRITRGRCLRDLPSCKRELAEALGIELGWPRPDLPNDAL